MRRQERCLLLAKRSAVRAFSPGDDRGLTLLSLHPTCDDAVRGAPGLWVATEEMERQKCSISFTIRGAEYVVTRIGKGEKYPRDQRVSIRWNDAKTGMMR